LEGKQRLTTQLNRIVSKARQIQEPYEQSFFMLVHLSYLQAFIDVNKRTARLTANIPLVRHNLVPVSFNDIAIDDYNSALISCYELNQIEPLAQLYVWSAQLQALNNCMTQHKRNISTIKRFGNFRPPAL